MGLNDYLKQAREQQKAIGHFNFVTADVLRAIVEGAKEAGAPAVMVGTSEGEAGSLGMTEAVALVKAIREEYEFPVFLNADHFKSFEKCQEALDVGYDTVLIDGSKLGMEENIALVKKVKEYAGDRPVEGELGYLRGSSEVQQKVEISSADYTKPEEAKDFAERTGVDRLAVVFGNIHGIVKEVIHMETAPTLGRVGVPKPTQKDGSPTEASVAATSGEEHLDIEHFKKIVAMIPGVPIVLHGASGLVDAEVAEAIKAGVANVHFNTELRVAYKEGIEKAIHAKPNETTPYKYLAPAATEVRKLVMEKIRLFQG